MLFRSRRNAQNLQAPRTHVSADAIVHLEVTAHTKGLTGMLPIDGPSGTVRMSFRLRDAVELAVSPETALEHGLIHPHGLTLPSGVFAAAHGAGAHGVEDSAVNDVAEMYNLRGVDPSRHFVVYANVVPQRGTLIVGDRELTPQQFHRQVLLGRDLGDRTLVLLATHGDYEGPSGPSPAVELARLTGRPVLATDGGVGWTRDGTIRTYVTQGRAEMGPFEESARWTLTTPEGWRVNRTLHGNVLDHALAEVDESRSQSPGGPSRAPSSPTASDLQRTSLRAASPQPAVEQATPFARRRSQTVTSVTSKDLDAFSQPSSQPVSRPRTRPGSPLLGEPSRFVSDDPTSASLPSSRPLTRPTSLVRSEDSPAKEAPAPSSLPPSRPLTRPATPALHDEPPRPGGPAPAPTHSPTHSPAQSTPTSRRPSVSGTGPERAGSRRVSQVMPLGEALAAMQPERPGGGARGVPLRVETMLRTGQAADASRPPTSAPASPSSARLRGVLESPHESDRHPAEEERGGGPGPHSPAQGPIGPTEDKGKGKVKVEQAPLQTEPQPAERAGTAEENAARDEYANARRAVNEEFERQRQFAADSSGAGSSAAPPPSGREQLEENARLLQARFDSAEARMRKLGLLTSAAPGDSPAGGGSRASTPDLLPPLSHVPPRTTPPTPAAPHPAVTRQQGQPGYVAEVRPRFDTASRTEAHPASSSTTTPSVPGQPTADPTVVAPGTGPGPAGPAPAQAGGWHGIHGGQTVGGDAVRFQPGTDGRIRVSTGEELPSDGWIRIGERYVNPGAPLTIGVDGRVAPISPEELAAATASPTPADHTHTLRLDTGLISGFNFLGGASPMHIPLYAQNQPAETAAPEHGAP